jgi:predicted HTH transcriptional regulator
MKKTKEKILDYIKSKEKVSYKELKQFFSSINESTLVRNLNSLIKT